MSRADDVSDMKKEDGMRKQLLLRYLVYYKKEILCVLFFSLLTSVMTVACSTIMNNVIAETLNGNGSGLWVALILLCCIAIVWVFFVYAQRFSSGKLGIYLTRRLRQDITEKLMAVRYECFVEQESGTFINQLNDDIRDTADYIDKLLSSILSNGIIIIVIAVYLSTVDWKLMLASILWIPIATLIFRGILKKISTLSWEKKRRQDKLTNIIQESFASTETEKSFNLQERNLEIANNWIEKILAVDLQQQKQESSENIIKDISFEIKRGERVAFVGGSGSGKTTLINLILGLYPIEYGNYNLYEIPFSDINLEDARKCFSIVSQETFLFPDTIEENLRYGNRNAAHWLR